jgi:hypothetical protein
MSTHRESDNTPKPPANIRTPSFGSDVAAKSNRATLKLAVDHVSSVKLGSCCDAALPKLKHACIRVTVPAAAPEARRAARKCRRLCSLCDISLLGAINLLLTKKHAQNVSNLLPPPPLLLLRTPRSKKAPYFFFFFSITRIPVMINR